VREDEAFKDLIQSVNQHDGKINSIKIMHETMKKLMEKRNKSNNGGQHNHDTDFEVITHQIQSLLMNGTTMISLSSNKENEKRLLILTGFWSGGAVDPSDVNLNGISFSACQHFKISNEGLLNRVYDFPSPYPLAVSESTAEFRMKVWSL